jgi:hypothetical protein
VAGSFLFFAAFLAVPVFFFAAFFFAAGMLYLLVKVKETSQGPHLTTTP